MKRFDIESFYGLFKCLKSYCIFLIRFRISGPAIAAIIIFIIAPGINGITHKDRPCIKVTPSFLNTNQKVPSIKQIATDSVIANT